MTRGHIHIRHIKYAPEILRNLGRFFRITILRRLRLIRCSLSATGRELLAPSVSQLIRGFASIRSVSIEGQGFQASQLNGSVIRACIAKGVRALSFPAGMPCTYISEYAILDFCFDANAVSSNLPTRRRLEIWQPRISTRLIENFVEVSRRWFRSYKLYTNKKHCFLFFYFTYLTYLKLINI